MHVYNYTLNINCINTAAYITDVGYPAEVNFLWFTILNAFERWENSKRASIESQSGRNEVNTKFKILWD